MSYVMKVLQTLACSWNVVGLSVQNISSSFCCLVTAWNNLHACENTSGKNTDIVWPVIFNGLSVTENTPELHHVCNLMKDELARDQSDWENFVTGFSRSIVFLLVQTLPAGSEVFSYPVHLWAMDSSRISAEGSQVHCGQRLPYAYGWPHTNQSHQHGTHATGVQNTAYQPIRSVLQIAWPCGPGCGQGWLVIRGVG